MKTKIDKLADRLDEQRSLCNRMMGSRWLWLQWLPGTLLGAAALAVALLA